MQLKLCSTRPAHAKVYTNNQPLPKKMPARPVKKDSGVLKCKAAKYCNVDVEHHLIHPTGSLFIQAHEQYTCKLVDALVQHS